jgi:hypothetical protein
MPDPKAKKPYEKPLLRTIGLLAEEVLAVGCKTATGNPGHGRFGAPSCLVSACLSEGS